MKDELPKKYYKDLAVKLYKQNVQLTKEKEELINTVEQMHDAIILGFIQEEIE